MAPFRPALPRILVKGPSLFTVALRSTAVERRCPEIILVGFDQVPSKLLRSQTSSSRGALIGAGIGAKVRGTVLSMRM